MSKENERSKSSEKEKSSSAKSKEQNKKSASKSPEKSESGKNIKSAKSRRSAKGASRSPKRRSTSRSAGIKTENLADVSKSTPEFDDLSSQGLTTLSSKITQKTTLMKLILSGNNLRSLPASISELINLEYLDLSRNPLRVRDIDDVTCLPVEMRLLKNLKFLSLSECYLRTIPTTVWLCVSIQILDLSRNKIGLLVPDVGNLQNLKTLNISQCNLTTLPGEIGFCFNLEEIILMANQIDSLPDNLKDCKNLKQLRLSFRSFNTLLDSYMENLISKGQIKSEHIPMVIFELQSLMYLDLKSTKCNYISENSLIGLKELYLDNNYFDRFSEGVLQPMSNSLKVLTMSHNLLKEIPVEINCLLNLEILDLSYNLITQITNNSKLINLKDLNLSNNKLAILNDNIKYFKSLKKLNLLNNELHQLSENLYELENLTYLDLSYNRLVKISANICKLKFITCSHLYDNLNKIGLWLIGNPLKIPCKEVWQTTQVQNIYDYISGYNQKHLDYLFYSKLVFLGVSGVGKSKLVDSFFNNVNRDEENQISQSEYKTQALRKLDKRTSNKVEWMIIDLGGDKMYQPLHPILFSSIDPDNEPTIYVIIYNHSNYTTNKYHHYIGQWIESILTHSSVSETKPLQLKLIGMVNSSYNEEGDENKINSILHECEKTVESFKEKFLNEKKRIDGLINSVKASENNQNKQFELRQLEAANFRINLLLKSKVYLNDSITMLDESFKKDDLNHIVKTLETITIRFNKTVPLDLKFNLKSFIVKLKEKQIDYNTFTNKLKENTDLDKFMKSFPRFQLDHEKLLYYSKTIGEIFWMKYSNLLNNKIYLQFDYVINGVKLFLNHNLSNELVYSERSMFKNLGLYSNNDDFSVAAELANNYGIFEWQIIYGISFGKSLLNQQEIKDYLDLLEDLLIIYKSETQNIEGKCSYFKVVVPSGCMVNFEEQKSSQTWDIPAELFMDNFEIYFIKLDLMRVLREKIKKENAFKKRREMFNFSEENDYPDTKPDQEKAKSITENVTQLLPNQSNRLINLNYFSEVEFSKISSETDVILNKLSLYEKNCLLIECDTCLKFSKNVFSTLSVLLQKIFYERVDWNDTIIARNLEETCFKVNIENLDNENGSKIKFNVKSIDLKNLEKIKPQILEILNNLFNFYPGLDYHITIKKN